jgi:SanA protein
VEGGHVKRELMAKIRGRRLLVIVLVAADVVVFGAFAANLVIARAAKGKTYSDVGLIPHRSVGLVLGCSKRVADGRLNLFFLARAKAAAELYQRGKVDYLLASGSSTAAGEDEAGDLKRELIGEGVPADRIYVDRAGFRTLDSVVRAREVFGQTRITVVSQKFQVQRALFIANHSGMSAIGFNAPEVFSGKTVVRESLARVKAILDVYLFRMQPRMAGQTAEIENAAQGLASGGGESHPK